MSAVLGTTVAINTTTQAAAETGAMAVPVSGTITSIYGLRCNSGTRDGHQGIDIAAPLGTPIRATYSGEVTTASRQTGANESFGNMILIRHPEGYRSRYAHLSRIQVSVGDKVSKGQIIGEVGSTGSTSTGPHLHLEIDRFNTRSSLPLNDAFSCKETVQRGEGIRLPFDDLAANPSTTTPDPIDETVFRYLTNNNSDSGRMEKFSFGRATDQQFTGDWNGDGRDTPGVRRGNTWYLSNDPHGGGTITSFSYGSADMDVVIGDWNKDGKDGVGVVLGNAWYLRNATSAGSPDYTFNYGSADDTKIAGDWDGDGIDTPGVVRGNTWYLHNKLDGHAAETTLGYGSADDTKIVGDWDGDGIDTPGVVRGNTWFIKDNQVSGNGAVRSFTYGRSGEFPLAGDWDGNGSDTAGILRAG